METKDNAEIINAEAFNLLSMGEKALMLWGQGKFITIWKEEGKYKIGIYLLHNTIVSVYYNVTTDAIHNIIMWGWVVNKSKILENAIPRQTPSFNLTPCI